MRLPLIGLTILTDKGRAAIEAEARETAPVGHLLKRYATDETCLKAAFATRVRTRADNPFLFVPAGSLENESRVISAFADAVIQERREGQP